jgi:hypothetical protein
MILSELLKMKKINIKDISCSIELRRLLISLERNCTVECCKADAFEVNKETIEFWRTNESKNNDDLIYNELFELKQENYCEYNFINLNIRGLESQWRINEFTEFVDLLLIQFHKVIYM